MILLMRALISVYQDFALETYRNATMEKIAYIRHLMQRAEKEDEARTLWQSLLLVSLQTFYSDSPPSAFGFHRTSRVPLAASRRLRGLSIRSTLISQPEFFMNCSRSLSLQCRLGNTPTSTCELKCLYRLCVLKWRHLIHNSRKVRSTHWHCQRYGLAWSQRVSMC